MYATYPASDFLLASKADITQKADNQNSLFSMEELQKIYALARPYLRSGFLELGRLDNSFSSKPQHTIIAFNYAPVGSTPPRLAFLIQKTLNEDAVSDFQAQFNIHTDHGWLETKRTESINLSVVLADLRNCINTRWSRPEPAFPLIHG
jgi:hypothetical protein